MVWYDLEHEFKGKKCTKGCPYLSVAQTGTVPHSRSYICHTAGFLGLDAMTSGVMPLALGVAGQGTKPSGVVRDFFKSLVGVDEK